MAVPALGGSAANAPRAPRALALWGIGLAGAAAAAAAAALTFSGDDGRAPHVHAGLVAWDTLAYVLCGLVAWWRRPGSRFGPLMVAAGFTPLLARLGEFDEVVPQSVGDPLRALPPVVLLHVFLAYPTGQLRSRVERASVAAAYSTAIGLAVLIVVLAAFGHPDGAATVLTVQRSAVITIVLGSCAVVFARWRSTDHSFRRRPDGVVACFVLALGTLAAAMLFALISGAAFEPVRWIAFALVGMVPVLLLIGFLRARLARSAVADLFVELGSDPGPAELQEALARVLRDPSLRLTYWLPEFGSYADLEGRAVELPRVDDASAVTFVDRAGVQVAALVHDPALLEEHELLDAVTAAVGIAIENARLNVELRARVEDLRGSRARILEAGRKERQRLERNLHDGAQQRLIALSLDLGLLEGRLAENPEARARLEEARQEIATSLTELREIARGLHPAVVSGHGLEVALEQLVAHASVPVRLTVELDKRLPEPLEVAAFYVVSESLANLGKYALASDATVEVTRGNGQVLVEIIDNGIGGADTERGSGLRGLADRVEALGGRLRVWSPRGGGTRVRAEIPCAP